MKLSRTGSSDGAGDMQHHAAKNRARTSDLKLRKRLFTAGSPCFGFKMQISRLRSSVVICSANAPRSPSE